MEQVAQTPLGQEVAQQSPQSSAIASLSLYQPPQVTVFGTVIQLTRGSGGDYDDECTSGKWPGDE